MMKKQTEKQKLVGKLSINSDQPLFYVRLTLGSCEKAFVQRIVSSSP